MATVYNALARFRGFRVIELQSTLRISSVDFHIWVFPVNWTWPRLLSSLQEPRFYFLGCLHTKDDFLLFIPEQCEISAA